MIQFFVLYLTLVKLEKNDNNEDKFKGIPSFEEISTQKMEVFGPLLR